MKRLFIAVSAFSLAVLTCFVPSAFAANRAGALTLSPFAGYYLFESNQSFAGGTFEDSPVYGLALGYNFSERLGIEAVGAYVQAESSGSADNIDVYQGRLDLLYHFRPQSNFVPYLAGGIGAIRYHDLISEKNLLADVGLGFKYFFNETVAFRADARGLFDIDTDRDGEDAYEQLAVTGGLTFQFGGSEPAPRPVEVVEPVEPTVQAVPDSDEDGVNDDLDRCPGTPTDIPVDASGCPRDSDGDGVADYLDDCPDTPAGAAVDASGCSSAAAADSDGDGVPNEDDKCPNTPEGMNVNLYGCPSDEDKDGVFDYEDECPGTLAGTRVGPDGCPLPEPATMDLRLDFETNSARIRPEFDAQLKEAAEFIKANPGTRVTVEGHTDAIGSAAYNLRLSERRAENVRTYLIEHYDVAPERIEAVGYGEEQPIAPNNTPEGRIMNRRVGIRIE